MTPWTTVDGVAAYPAGSPRILAKVGVTERDEELDESLRSEDIAGGEGMTGPSLDTNMGTEGGGTLETSGVGIKIGCWLAGWSYEPTGGVGNVNGC